ncbi:hypothetical protein DFP72DRAFT_877626 [Ephemerocybe angulata]|uniref:Uncharacterized protein n=1 Tax=Ephemerocybe angulata TaxID=980116 RepID=A0A8H6MFC4_9AGAR|nr:hypothetical protein DFP72DRAFT_877626 [Tulosesus angulatus]
MNDPISEDGLKTVSASALYRRQSLSDLSVTSVSNRATALDVCYSVYGEATPSAGTTERFYENNAGNLSYENPFITASSRSVIGDIHRLSGQLSVVHVPRPLAVLCTIFRVRSFHQLRDDPLFQALRVWTEIQDISESESFDGNRKVIVEHTLHVLLLPGIHCEGPLSHSMQPPTSDLSAPQTPLLSHSPLQTPPPFLIPSLPIPGTSISLPSPLHSRLRIMSRLSFNEQGRITHHRDFWDVKDVMGLVPGVSLAQWIGTRLAATGLSYLSHLLPSSTPPPKSARKPDYITSDDGDLELGVSSL